MKLVRLITLTVRCMSILPLITQPLTIGMVIMLSTLLMCLLMAAFLRRWYAYILFLIYVGGLLVMFAYVVALSPNTIFKDELHIPIMFLFVFALLFMYLYISVLPGLSVLEETSMGGSRSFIKECGSELVSPFSISILVGLACILLINLIVVVKICFFQSASLRPFRVEYAFACS